MQVEYLVIDQGVYKLGVTPLRSCSASSFLLSCDKTHFINPHLRIPGTEKGNHQSHDTYIMRLVLYEKEVWDSYIANLAHKIGNSASAGYLSWVFDS